jgi:hypothetical protein
MLKAVRDLITICKGNIAAFFSKFMKISTKIDYRIILGGSSSEQKLLCVPGGSGFGSWYPTVLYTARPIFKGTKVKQILQIYFNVILYDLNLLNCELKTVCIISSL